MHSEELESSGNKSVQPFMLMDTTSATDNFEQLEEMEDTRDGPHLITKVQGFMMLFKFCVGAGWFSIPAAFMYSGMLVGVLCVVIIGILTAVGMQKIVAAAWEVSRRTGNTFVSFGDVGEECARVFNTKRGTVGRLLVEITIASTVYLLLFPMILFVAKNWKQGFQPLIGDDVDISIWILVTFFVLVPLFLIKRPEILATFALFTNIITGASLGIMLIYFFTDTSSWKASTKVTWPKVPMTLGIVSFAFEIAALILSVENVMKKPREIPLVINGVMALVTFMYIVIGCIGYAWCQDKCEDTIILNLPTSWYFSLMKALLGVVGCCSSTLLSLVTISIIEPPILKQVPEERGVVMSVLLRMFMLASACAISAAVPQLANLMSLVGSIVNCLIGLIFPAIANMILLHHKLSKLAMAENTVLLIFGTLILLFAVYTSFVEIVHDY